MRFLFVLEDGWFKEFVGGGVPELGELGIVLSHEVHDVAQRRHVQGVALQCRHHDRAQPLDDLGVASLREREVLTAVFGIASAMLKRFIRKFVSVPAKWTHSARRDVLTLYTKRRAYLELAG